MTEQKGKGYQGIWATETFEYKNTRKDFKYCYYWENWKTISDYRVTRDPRGLFRQIKVTPEIDYITDKTVLQCDAQDVENTFIDDSK